MKQFFTKIIFAIALAFLFVPFFAFAKVDLSISDTDITLSKDNLIAGQTVRVYARVFNNGDTDVYGFVMFYASGKEISQPQPISVRSNNYDDVFIDWTPVAGTYDLQAKIINTNPTDENLANNVVYKKNIFVDADVNKNGIGDSKDQAIIEATKAAAAATTMAAQSQTGSQTQSGQGSQANQNSGSGMIANIEKSIQGVLGAKTQDSNWLVSLKKYLNSASQNSKSSGYSFSDYLLWVLIAVFLVLSIFWR